MQLQLIGLRNCYGFYQEEGKKASGKKQPLEMFYEKGFFKTLAKSTGKHLLQCHLLQKTFVAASQITSSCHPKRLFFLNMGHCANTKRIRLQILGQVEFLFVCVVLNIFFLFFTNFFFFFTARANMGQSIQEWAK